MASYYKLPTEERSDIGTGSAREIRRNGKIPANYYYHGESNQNLIIDKKIFLHAVKSGQRVFECEINGETVFTMIKDAQYHPVTEDVIHIDLMRVRRDQKMIVSIPIILEGESVGASEGGIVTQATNTVEIECLPTDVPENLIADISALELNSAMTAVDLVLPTDVSLVSPEETTIVTCNPPKAEVEPEPEEVEGEEGEEVEGEEAGDGTTDEEGEDDKDSKDDSDQGDTSKES
ncbi:MAG: 50S ribosomal protein L25 [Candidatus Marinimicrobia bacterium]|jgi:large subunit ribosomal protein L25|nr:50S ribosomal protein L25 [Candidatus Neomarinimicrobiota bacterium]MBT3947766.1 50S ribosomal protein L25 [Candidatus Neomarinimicrobiota bacterium]MBT4307656.1 50S ribosomal protein L25 [Candidatus Neomarinimicrobiota bacterium]MBT4453580.1 50S ribosomal protein L25 [Candidatus Neomarinimicrobiota bacterium]MBT5387123.1 50S ribosomal protein L25 [Candidatus Neomarinimicrobiota bacterium]